MNNSVLQTGTTFGIVLRAARLGYRISRKHGAFVKIEDVDERTVNVTLVPTNQQVPKKRGKQKHYCWWEQKNADEPPLLDLIPALNNIRRVKKVVSFDIDRETGQSVPGR